MHLLEIQVSILFPRKVGLAGGSVFNKVANNIPDFASEFQNIRQ